jgi:hypothetical protein
LNCGISRSSTRTHLALAAPRRSSAYVIRHGASSRRRIS